MGKALTVTTTGLEIAPDVSYEQWAEETGNFLHFANMTPLYSGDAMVYAVERWGEAKAFAILPDIGKVKHTVQNWMSIARSIPPHRRVDGLEAGHYDAIRGIKDSDGNPLIGRQDQMIERAAREGWPVSRTRQEAAEARDRAQGKLIDVPDTGNDEVQDDDTPVMDAGAIGDALDAERVEQPTTYDTGSGDPVDTLATQIRSLGFIDRSRLWSQIHHLFPLPLVPQTRTGSTPAATCAAPGTLGSVDGASAGGNSSQPHVEQTLPKAVPCVAPSAESEPPGYPADGGVSHNGFDADGEAIPPNYLREQGVV